MFSFSGSSWNMSLFLEFGSGTKVAHAGVGVEITLRISDAMLSDFAILQSFNPESSPATFGIPEICAFVVWV